MDVGFFSGLIVGLVLLAAGAAKTLRNEPFAKALPAFGFLPERSHHVIARALPILEMVVGMALLLRLFAPVPSLSAALLFLLFATAVSMKLLLGGEQSECGCFGFGSQLSWSLVLRNLAFVLLAAGSMGLRSALPFVVAAALVLLFAATTPIPASTNLSKEQTRAKVSAGS